MFSPVLHEDNHNKQLSKRQCLGFTLPGGWNCWLRTTESLVLMAASLVRLKCCSLWDSPRASSQSLASMSLNLGACFFFYEDVDRLPVANEHHHVLVLYTHSLVARCPWGLLQMGTGSTPSGPHGPDLHLSPVRGYGGLGNG